MHKSQGLSRAFPSLSDYSLLALSRNNSRSLQERSKLYSKNLYTLNTILEIEDCLMKSFFLGIGDETLVLTFNKGQSFTYSYILG